MELLLQIDYCKKGECAVNLCKGVCERFAIKKFNGKNTRYENNQKRCPICEVYMDWSDIRCPCCRCILRMTPRANKSRKLFHERKNDVRL